MTAKLSTQLQEDLIKIASNPEVKIASDELLQLVSEKYVTYNVFAGWIVTDKGRRNLRPHHR